MLVESEVNAILNSSPPAPPKAPEEEMKEEGADADALPDLEAAATDAAEEAATADAEMKDDTAKAAPETAAEWKQLSETILCQKWKDNRSSYRRRLRAGSYTIREVHCHQSNQLQRIEERNTNLLINSLNRI